MLNEPVIFVLSYHILTKWATPSRLNWKIVEVKRKRGKHYAGKTGKTIQAGENVPYGYCLYCVGIWVIDSEKKILLTKRSSQKRYAPGKWENTGGHMISGETSRHAIVRELKEETGIQIEEDELIELGDNHIGQFLGDNYAVFKDVALDEVHLEEGETEDVIKVTLPQLEEMAEKKMLSPAVWDHMAGYKDEFYRLFD